MKKELIIIGKNYNDVDQLPKGKNIYYRCLQCGETIPFPSIKDQVGGCKCGNIYIDLVYVRIDIKDFCQLEVLEKV